MGDEAGGKKGDGEGGEKKPIVDPAVAAGAGDAALRAELAQLKKERDDRKAADDAADVDRKKKLKEDGDLKKLYEDAQSDLAKRDAKLAELDADARLGKSHRESLSKAVAEGKSKLTPAQRDLVETLERVDISKAAALVAELSGVKPTSTTPTPITPGGAPSSEGALGFEAAWKGGEKTWKEAKARDLAGATAWLSTALAGGDKKNTPLQFLPRKQPTPVKK